MIIKGKKAMKYGELKKAIEELHKDPELMEIAKKFVIRHGGRIPS